MRNKKKSKINSLHDFRNECSKLLHVQVSVCEENKDLYHQDCIKCAITYLAPTFNMTWQPIHIEHNDYGQEAFFSPPFILYQK